MRKIIMLTTLITLFGAGALAHASDTPTTETGSAEATRPVVRGEEYAHERHFESRRGHHDARRGHREHHDEAHERQDERWEHGRRHH
jgi:Ni/Co efflux regulator RcnB